MERQKREEVSKRGVQSEQIEVQCRRKTTSKKDKQRQGDRYKASKRSIEH